MIREQAVAETRRFAVGGDLDSLVGELKAREARRRDLLAVIAASDTRARYDPKAIEQRVRERLDGWRALLALAQQHHVDDGRQLFREVMEGPVLFTPEGGSYRFEGHLGLGRLIAGVVGDDVQPLWCARRDSNPRPTGSKPVALSN
jgi:hypothetical protein